MTDEVMTDQVMTDEVMTDEVMTDDEAGALATADAIVRRFGAHDVSGYVDLFAPSATFVLPPTEVS